MKSLTKALMIMFAMFMCSCADKSNDAVAQTTLSQKMYITIDGVSQPVTLYNNAATQALIAKLEEGPVTVTLNSSGGLRYGVRWVSRCPLAMSRLPPNLAM